MCKYLLTHMDNLGFYNRTSTSLVIKESVKKRGNLSPVL